jgi:ATP-binding cassette subfamily C protein CydCD
MDRDGRALTRRLLRGVPAARPALLGVGATAALTAGLALAQAALLADVVARAFLGHTPLGELTPDLVALAAVLAARALTTALFDVIGRRGALRVMSDLRARLARSLLVERPGLSGQRRSGELATAAVQGVDALEAWFARYLPQLLLAAVMPPAVLAYAATRDLAAALVLAATVPVLIVFMVLVGLAAQAHARTRWQVLGQLGAHFADVVRSLDVLRAHGREQAQVQTVGAMAERYRVATMATLRVAFLSALVLELVAMIGTALVAATIGLQLAAGHLALADGLCVLLLAPELYAPLRGVGQQFHASADGFAGAERIFAVLDEPPLVTRRGEQVAPDPRRDAVVLEHVDFGYGDGPLVLGDVTLTLGAGETVALCGPSGGGKSTLAALLVRLADPVAGTIRCAGADLAGIDLDAWRARLAWIPQRPVVVAGTIADNVRLAAPDASAAAVTRALGSAGLGPLLAGLPAGIDTAVGDGGRPLSAGEAQRLALARAFARDADLVILDEPTAHLDAAAAAAVTDAVAALCATRTALVITHDPALAARADRVVELRAGRLAAAPAAIQELVA